jgi:two-component system phosphate regulon sensor histidine kinase PhoR
MTSRTLRTFTLLSVLVLLGLVGMQAYWFRQAYQTEDRDFDRRVTSALRVVCQRLVEAGPHPNHVLPRPVERVSANYYTAQINDVIDPVVLEEFLKQEFARHDLRTNFEYGIYDCQRSQMEYGGFVCHTANCDSTRSVKYRFPRVAGQNYFFGVYFPEKRGYLFNQLGIWAASSAALLVVTGFLAYALFVIFRQKRLSEIQTDFVNNLTHEFKTPLSTILISTDVLTKPNQPAERLAQYATLIRAEANRLRQHVDTVLQTARVDQPMDGLTWETVDVHEVIREFVAEQPPAWQERGTQIEIKLLATNSRIRADRRHVATVFHNLLDNAVKYATQAPHLTIQTQNEGGLLKISFSDNGIGIADDQLRRIFDKFYRVPTGDVHNVKGFGLGLYYVRTMVRRFRGRIEVRSRVGEGSTFGLAFKTVESA